MSQQDYLVEVQIQGNDSATGFEDDWRENMKLPMYRDYWSRSEARFGPEFRYLINQIVIELDDR